MIFKYTGFDKLNNKVSGYTAVLDSEIVYIKIKLVSIRPPRNLEDGITFFYYIRQFMLSNKLIVDALKEIVNLNKYVPWTLSLIYYIERGYTLSGALTIVGHRFDKFIISILNMSDNLVESCALIIDYLNRRNEMRKTIISVMRYPILVLFTMICLTFMFIFFILPELGDIVKPEPWNIKGILPFLIIIPIIKNKLIYFPVVGKIIVQNYLVEIFQYLVILEKNNLNQVEAMQIIINNCKNNLFRKSLESILFNIKKGEGFSSALCNLIFLDNNHKTILRSSSKTAKQFESYDLILIDIVERRKELIKKIEAYFQPIILVVLAIVILVINRYFLNPIYSSIAL